MASQDVPSTFRPVELSQMLPESMSVIESAFPSVAHTVLDPHDAPPSPQEEPSVQSAFVVHSVASAHSAPDHF